MAHSPHRPFDLVILDLDGTILDLYQPAPIAPAVQKAIAAVQAAGIPVTIGTGRTFEYVRQYVAPLRITTPVVTTQGAVIGDPRTGRVLDRVAMPLPLARRAAAWIDEHDYVTAFYFSDEEGRTHIVQNRNGPEEAFYDHVFGTPRTYQERLTALLADETVTRRWMPLKFLIVCDAVADDGQGGYGDTEEEDKIVAELEAALSPGLYITRTHPRLVEGTPQGADKGEGLRRLCRLLGIDPARVLAIGDSDNDIPMLETAGYAVAMGNASPGVRAVADWVAPSLSEDGVARALERLILAPLSAGSDPA